VRKGSTVTGLLRTDLVAIDVRSPGRGIGGEVRI